MKIERTNIHDVIVIQPSIYKDERGWFIESFNDKVFFNILRELNIESPKKFVQDNHSKSNKGVLRGLHFQSSNPQGKLVRVISGVVYDVAVDIRRSSKTFGKIVSVILSGRNKKQLWIPPGFAHGFYVMSSSAEFCYKTTDYYFKDFEKTILWNDPDLAIDWPITAGPFLSSKDASGMSLKSWKG